MTCPYCKKSIDDDSDFCVHCGKSVVDDEANIARRRNKTRNGIIISGIVVVLLIVGIIAIVQHNKAENNRIIKEAYLTIAQENPRGRNSFVTLLNEYFTEGDLKNYPDLVLADWEFDEANKSYTYSGNTPVKYSITYTTCQMDDETQDVNTVKAQVTIPDNGVPDDAVDFLAGVGYAFVMPVYKSSDVDRNNYAEFVYYSVTQPKAHDAGENFYYFGNVLARIDIYVTDGVAYLSALRYSTAQLKAQSIAQSSITSQPFSRANLIDHLLSLDFTSEDAELAIDCLDIDWEGQARRTANNLLLEQPFSRDGLIAQLTNYRFNTSDATSAVDSLDVSWTEQAILWAQKFIVGKTGQYTKEQLQEAVEAAKFTPAQASLALKQVQLAMPSDDLKNMIERFCAEFSLISNGGRIGSPEIKDWLYENQIWRCEVGGLTPYSLYLTTANADGSGAITSGKIVISLATVKQPQRDTLMVAFLSAVDSALDKDSVFSTLDTYRSSGAGQITDVSLNPSSNITYSFDFNRIGYKDVLSFTISV